MEEVIKVSNLSKSYSLENGGKVQALKNVSFNLHQGEVLGIIGKSGGGKTTLIRILRGVENFDEGEVWINNIHLTPNSSEEDFRKVREITVLHLQRSFGLWSSTTIENVMRRLYAIEVGDEVVALPPVDSREYQKLREEGLRILKAIMLDSKADYPVYALSGGEKQRLVLARQLVLAGKKSKVLLLDEPVTMSCLITKQATLDWIKSIKEQLNISIIVASHLPSIITYVADRALWLDGKIHAEGEPREVVKKFLAQMEEPVMLKPLERKKTVLSIKSLTKRYYAKISSEDTFRIEDINFDVYDKEILGIVGPSGAGKTVLIRLLSGLELPDSGKIICKIGGKEVDITSLGYRSLMMRRKFGIVHQELDLAYHATVREMASTRLGVKGEKALTIAKKRAKKMGLKEELVDTIHRIADLPESEIHEHLEKIGLDKGIIEQLFPIAPWKAVSEVIKPMLNLFDLNPELLNRKSYELSGGEKIRLSILLEVLYKPKILFLDEPFGDLDPVTLRKLTNILKIINTSFKMSIILVSHHIDFVKEIAHRAIFIKDGKIVEEGEAEKVCKRFVEESKATFIE